MSVFRNQRGCDRRSKARDVILRAALVLIAIGLAAQERPGLAGAKAMDREILDLGDLPDGVRERKIEELAVRIRTQPEAYAVALASNLVIAVEAIGPGILQDVTDTLAEAVRRSPGTKYDGVYAQLAELARYSHMKVSLDDPRYRAAMAKLQDDDRHRGEADFTLTDVEGRTWHLKSLRGKVVLVNFWATWCPPCQREIPTLNALYQRFRDRGLVVLAITDEESSKVKPVLGQRKIGYPVLLDPGRKVRDLFRVVGIPENFVYDRDGRLVAQMFDRPTMRGFLEILGQAGLRSGSSLGGAEH